MAGLDSPPRRSWLRNFTCADMISLTTGIFLVGPSCQCKLRSLFDGWRDRVGRDLHYSVSVNGIWRISG